MYNGKKVILTTTACRRINLLRGAIKSFGIFCTDKNIIDEIYYFDDSSAPEDRNTAIDYYHKHIPNTPVIYNYFEKNSFPDKFRHARILNIWLEYIKKSNTDYVFHLEDDFQFYNMFSMAEAIDIMENNSEYAYIGYGSSWKNFPKEMQPKKVIGNFWENLYYPNIPINAHLFLDETAAMCEGVDWWIYYLNWPYFSLRPGIHHANRLLSVGEFSVNHDKLKSSAELDFAIRWTNKGYKSMTCKNLTVLHKGNDQSAYHINDSSR